MKKKHKLKSYNNKNISIVERIIYVLVTIYIAIKVFLPFIGENYLRGLSFTVLVAAAVVGLVLAKKHIVLKQSDLLLFMSLFLWLGWYRFCAKSSNMGANADMAMSITVILLIAFILNGNINQLHFTYFPLIIFLTTIITVIISNFYLATNGSIARMIATGMGEYSRLGIGSYDFVYSLALISPCFIFHIKRARGIKKYVIIAYFVFIGIYLFQCGLVTSFLLYLLGIGIYFLMNLESTIKRRTLIIILIIGLILLSTTGMQLISEVLYKFQDVSDNQFIKEKSMDIIRAISGDSEIYGTISGRTSRYRLAFDGFLSSPIWGTALGGNSISSGGHSLFLDYLSLTGIIGFTLYYFVIIISYRRIQSSIYTKHADNCMKTVFTLYLVFACTKGAHYASIVWAVFYAAPLYIRSIHHNKTMEGLENESASNQ